MTCVTLTLIKLSIAVRRYLTASGPFIPASDQRIATSVGPPVIGNPLHRMYTHLLRPSVTDSLLDYIGAPIIG